MRKLSDDFLMVIFRGRPKVKMTFGTECRRSMEHSDRIPNTEYRMLPKVVLNNEAPGLSGGYLEHPYQLSAKSVKKWPNQLKNGQIDQSTNRPLAIGKINFFAHFLNLGAI